MNGKILPLCLFPMNKRSDHTINNNDHFDTFYTPTHPLVVAYKDDANKNTNTPYIPNVSAAI